MYVEETRDLLIYEGVATRPDTNHRYHAIIRMHKTYRKWVRETGDETMEGCPTRMCTQSSRAN